MARRYVPKTYKNYRVARILLKTVLFIALVGTVLFVSLFFGLRKYYDEDTGRMNIPFLTEDNGAAEGR